MSFFIRHRWGRSERDPPLDSLSALYDELENEDDEHPSVSLTYETEWCLGAYVGLLIWENLESELASPQHMRNVSKEKTLELWRKLAAGNISGVQAEPWQPGYG